MSVSERPVLEGRRIRIVFRPGLSVSRGKLLSNAAIGQAVHAASYIRRREIVLDTELVRQPGDMARILVHELCHFAWVRLGNHLRRSWGELLANEIRRSARGELGWSANLRKSQIGRTDITRRPRRWRDYCCESFCDTGAWLFAGLSIHSEFRLAQRWRDRRRDWFRIAGLAGRLPV